MMIIRQDYNWDPDNLPVQLNVEGFSNEEIIQKLPKELRRLVSEFWLDNDIGLCAGTIQIISLYNFKKYDSDQAFYADSFTISVPFAGHSLIWEVMFSHEDLLFAPNFNFEDDGFLMRPCILETIKTDVPSLGQWDPHNTKSLMNVIKELLSLFNKYEINKLNENDKYSRLSFEYSALVVETNVNADEVEVLVEMNDVVHFLINISLDFSSLPPYINDCEMENPCSDFAMLLVTFHRLDGSRIQPQLRLSPRIEQILGGPGCKLVPSFSSQGCLMDYVPEIHKILTDRIEAIATNYKMKNEYISQILVKYGCNLIEYDSLNYSKITLLFEMKNFHWLLVIMLSNRFPQDKPKFILRSIYHMVNNKPYTEQLLEYPYSPRWSPEEMILRSFDYVFENITTFQNASTANNQI